MSIQINVRNLTASAVGAPVIVCGNSGYILEFSLDAEWDGLATKYARLVYVQGGKLVKQDLEITGNFVEVPVLIGVRQVHVGVFAGDLQTTTPVVIPCLPSIRCLSETAGEPTPGQYDMMMALLAQKVDGAYVEDGYLFMTAGGEIVVGPLGPFSGTGGGGGGGSENNAVLSVSNISGWLSTTKSQGAACPVSVRWSSLEDGLATGNGVLTIKVNGTQRVTKDVAQGEVTQDVGPYLAAGANTVQVRIADVYGNARTINYSVSVVVLELSSSFDAGVAYTGDIPFTYVPTGAAAKNMEFWLDGEQIGTAVVVASGRQQTFTIPAQSHGSHRLEAFFTADVEGVPVTSERLYYDIICLEDGNTAPIIASAFHGVEVAQYAAVQIPYRVYDPAGLETAILLKANGEQVGSLTVDRTQQVWSWRGDTEGEAVLEIVCGSTTKTFALTVTESDMDVEAETEGLELHLSSYGRNNNEENPGTWSYGDLAATLTGFNFKSDGWQLDNDGITVLRVGGDARVQIPLQIFAKDFRTTGKTIEIEFASRSVLDYDAVLATCVSGQRGFEITAQQAMLRSEQSQVSTRYKEDDHLRLSFVVEKRSGNRLILCYVNGIISGMLQYPDDDDFSQAEPIGISLGSNECTIDIYNIRVYDTDLNRFQILDNWIADTQDIDQRIARYERNRIFDQYDRILPDTLRPEQCYLVIDCPVLPTFKGDKKTCSGRYVDPVHPERSFTFTNAQIDVQGTSSQFYYVKNFKIKFKGGFIIAGETVQLYAMNESAVPTNEFTFKADVASSEGANNVVLAELYNDLCPVKTPAQEEDPRVRQCIEGHPIVVFHDDGSGAKFIGKYNFNNDKGTPEVFGFKTGDESWEIRENGNAQVSFKTADFTNWQTSFEARYPDGNTDISRLQQFVAWVASTDTTAAGLTEEEKAARLEKFRTELPDWADVNDAVFYYLFTLIFLCIDQREKNAFPTWNAEMQKWLWLFYDADSSIGTDNKGNLTFEYWMEDIDHTEAGDPVFNGQANVFWTNVRLCFGEKIRDLYRSLRTELASDGKPLLSFDRVDGLFTAHQSQWSEAIFNEDAWRKGVEPLEKVKDPQYLPMQQGKKEQHFKHWMYNRFRYLDSKFETGAALDDENRIMMRAHAQGDIVLTSFINMYGQVYYNSERAEHRMMRDQEYTFEWTAMGAEDAVIGVNSAPMITSLGDLSPLMLEYCHIQYATHLTELKVGDSAADYVNDNLVALTLGNNTLLRSLDARNCVRLSQSVDASGCTNLEHAYFDGTAISGLTLPNGGILKTLHLPGTITNLTIRNQPSLSDFVLPSYANITTLRLENVSSAVDPLAILSGIPANSRVRLIGIHYEAETYAEFAPILAKLDTMRGLDENGNNVDKAQVSGTVHIPALLSSELADINARYPSITVTYDSLVIYIHFYNEDGSQLLYEAPVPMGGNGMYVGAEPTKASTAQYEYEFAGWSKTPGGAVDADALANVTEDRSVYAVFTTTVRTYNVRFWNEDTLMQSVSVPYGGNATYTGNEPTKGDGYEFIGWEPVPNNVTANVDCYAMYKAPAIEGLYETGSNYTVRIKTWTQLINEGIITADGKVVKVNMLNKDLAISNEIIEVVASSYADCKYLTGARIQGVVTSIGNRAFYNCTALAIVEIIASITSIGDHAFRGCTALNSISIPASISSIGQQAFNGCTTLADISFGGTVAQWNDIGKGAYWNYRCGEIKVYCTDGTVTVPAS